jgi:exosortase B
VKEQISAATTMKTSIGSAEMILLVLGVLTLYVPTYVMLDQKVWNVVGQGHGPVMLALTCWLAWQRWPDLKKLPDEGNPIVGSAGLIVAVALYVLGRSQDINFFEVGSQIILFASLLFSYKGINGLKCMWFPILFILFLTPMPGPVVDAITAPLKSAVSYVAEWIMYKAGYPMGRAGVTLTIGPYKLLVADACAGLNSIFALEAIGVFYMSVIGHASKLRNILLAILILPVSFVSNVARVVILVLITYYFGDEAGQGFVHGFAGIVLFMIATALTIGVDSILGFFFAGDQNKKKA